MVDSMIDCKHCKKSCKYYGRHGLLYHIKTKKKCFESYSGEEIMKLEENSATTLKLKRKEYREKTKSKTKEYNKNYYKEKKPEVQTKSCKGCSKRLKGSIRRHLSHSKACESSDSQKEIAELKSLSAAQKSAKQRESYDPLKRSQMYRQKIEHDGETCPLSKPKQLLAEKRKIQCYGCKYFLKHNAKSIKCNDEYQNPSLKAELEKFQNNAKYRAEQKRIKRAEDYSTRLLMRELEEELPTEGRIECKKCKRKFETNRILGHIAKSVVCMDFYDTPSMKIEFNRIKTKCQKESVQRRRKVRAEKYQKEREEERLIEEREDLVRRRDNIKKLPKQLKEEAHLNNLDGFNNAKKVFEPEFRRFLAEKSAILHDDIFELENLIQNTFEMFENDIRNLSMRANALVRDINLDYESLRKVKSDLENLFKPLIGLHYQTDESFYTIRNDWHDTRLKIDLKMDQLAKSFGLSFKWVFNCTWLDIMPRICPKCKRTKGLDLKQEEYVNVFTKEFVE